MGTSFSKILSILIALLAFSSCRKVPLEEDYGTFDLATAYWFKDENVAYVFFSLAEREGLLINNGWELSYTAQTASGGTDFHDYEEIDLSKAFHQHQIQNCGDGRTCGSYSFALNQPLLKASIRFKYDQGSPLSLESDAFVDNSQTLSAYLYGVFDAQNQHVQARVENNFPLGPSSDQVASYGLTRKFAASNAILQDVPYTIQTELEQTQAQNFLFPASFCTSSGTDGTQQKFSALSYWLTDSFDSSNGDSGVCFTADFMDRNEKVYYSSTGFARKNPSLLHAGLNLQTPLQNMIQIPVVLEYCPNTPNYSELVVSDFFNYQEYILGITGRAVDVCFQVGGEADFTTNIQQELASRLATAKQQNTTGQDYIFVVLVHQNMTNEFTQFDKILATALSNIVGQEASNVSPRLVGAFVYNSDTNFMPPLTQQENLLWCPQEELPQNIDPNNPTMTAQNCITTPAAQLDLTVINFVAPLGPFPTLDIYENYVQKYGDKGLAHSPTLVFYSVPAGPNTQNYPLYKVTFFNNQTLSIAAGEAVKPCFDNPNSAALYSFEFLKVGDDPSKLMDITTVAPLWVTEQDTPADYKIGVKWEFPFWGGLSYTATLTGKIGAIIPFQKSASTYTELGDPKWQTQVWPFGDYVQFCRQYCDHPYFDASGTYQIGDSWRTSNTNSCPTPNIPVWNSGGQQ